MRRPKDGSLRAAAFIRAVLVLAVAAVSPLPSPARQPPPIRIDVNEANTGSLIFGDGVNSSNGLTGSIVLNERNHDIVAPSPDNSQRVPFDLSYLPPDAVGVVAMRPAEFFRQPGASVLAGPLNNAIAQVLKEFDVPGDPVLRLTAIEQIISEVQCAHNAKAPKGQQNQLMFGLTMIRTEKGFDWKERMRTVVPDAEEIHYRGKTYFKGNPKLFRLGLDICYFIPDERTLVLQSETTIRRVIDGQRGGSGFTASADWRRVEHGLFAAAVDIRRARKIYKEADPELAPVFENTANLVFGVNFQDALSIRAFAACADNKAAETLVTWVKTQIAKGVASLEKKKEDKADSVPLADRLARNLLQHTRVEQHGSQARLHTQAALDFAELGKLLTPPK